MRIFVPREASAEKCRVPIVPGTGLENPLFFKPNTALLYGDAKESLTRLVEAVRQA